MVPNRRFRGASGSPPPPPPPPNPFDGSHYLILGFIRFYLLVVILVARGVLYVAFRVDAILPPDQGKFVAISTSPFALTLSSLPDQGILTRLFGPLPTPDNEPPASPVANGVVPPGPLDPHANGAGPNAEGGPDGEHDYTGAAHQIHEQIQAWVVYRGRIPGIYFTMWVSRFGVAFRSLT